jgi:hypothetical protein
MSSVTQPVPHPGSTAAADAAWAKVRAMGDIQYTPLTPAPVPVQQDPAWLRALFAWLEKWFGPLARWLVLHWRAIEVGALVVLALVLVWIVWSLVSAPRRRARAAAADEAAAAWQPDAATASALLADADRLAAAGRFDEAVHLLLRRSFDDIAANRPDWLTPASTAREIARLSALPAAARSAFAVIAGEVERSRYALDRLGQSDWARARDAYAAFAVPPGQTA